VVQNLLAGVKLGLEQYFDPTQTVSRVQGIVFNWLFNNDDVRNQVSGLSQILANASFGTLDGLKKLVLDVAWQLSNASAINLDFLKQTIAQVTGYDPDTVMAQVTQFQQLLRNGSVSLDALRDQLPGLLDRVRLLLRSHFLFDDGREDVQTQVLWPKDFKGQPSLTEW
jgi:hypothetical protein